MFKSRNNVILNGIDLAERFNRNREFLVIKSVRGREYIPTSREVIQVPNKPGGYSKPLRTHPRILEIEYYIKASSWSDLLKRIEEFNEIIFDKEVNEIQFADEIDRVYYGDVENVAQTDEVLKVHQGKLTIVCSDPYKYAVIAKTTNGLTVHNQGTTDTPFAIEMDVTAPATHLAILGPDGESLQIGKPPSGRFEEELKFHDELENLDGWSSAPNILPNYPAPNGYAETGLIALGGSQSHFGNYIRLTNVTTIGGVWRGRTLVKSVGTVKDFRVESVMEMAWISGENGLSRQYVVLVDTQGKEIGRMGIVNLTGKKYWLEVRIGNEEQHQYLIDDGGSWAYNDSPFFKIILEKKSNVYRASVILLDKLTGVETGIEFTSFYTDVLNLYSSKDMVATAVHIANQDAVETARIYDIKVYEYVDADTLNPNVIDVGDKVVIDTDKRTIMINGTIRNNYKNINSDYYNLGTGKHELIVSPNVTENHKVTLRDRYL